MSIPLTPCLFNSLMSSSLDKLTDFNRSQVEPTEENGEKRGQGVNSLEFMFCP